LRESPEEEQLNSCSFLLTQIFLKLPLVNRCFS